MKCDRKRGVNTASCIVSSVDTYLPVYHSYLVDAQVHWTSLCHTSIKLQTTIRKTASLGAARHAKLFFPVCSGPVADPGQSQISQAIHG